MLDAQRLLDRMTEAWFEEEEESGQASQTPALDAHAGQIQQLMGALADRNNPPHHTRLASLAAALRGLGRTIMRASVPATSVTMRVQQLRARHHAASTLAMAARRLEEGNISDAVRAMNKALEHVRSAGGAVLSGRVRWWHSRSG
jgi:hypothetical protein